SCASSPPPASSAWRPGSGPSSGPPASPPGSSPWSSRRSASCSRPCSGGPAASDPAASDQVDSPRRRSPPGRTGGGVTGARRVHGPPGGVAPLVLEDQLVERTPPHGTVGALGSAQRDGRRYPRLVGELEQ